MGTSWRRCFIAGVSLACLSLPACMEVPLCIPEMSYVGPVDPGCPSTNLHAFRVDVTEKDVVDIDDSYNAVCGGVAYYELTPLQLSGRGTTSLQMALSCAYGWRYVGIWDHWPTRTTHSVAVRLYRRGYKTVEMRPGQSMPELEWTEVADLPDQEKAIDDLLGVSPLQSTSPVKPIKTSGFRSPPALELGTRSSGQREALLFAAGEYERLAASTDPEERSIRARLLDKARCLKELAAGKPREEPQKKTPSKQRVAPEGP
jgi:hypothetical protein